ncbi:GvpL/GvpF family gas vesicle protein [Streptomyces sp. NPDC001820]|uniref:GvpL/GvpF family gas vesicle protein n=1 Tax=Streptomyces sp. NPDC001820 TaxID=3364613 RepID=UPI0036A2CED2
MTASTSQTPGAESGWYVYGVVRESGATTEVEALPTVASADAQVTYVRHRGIAAVVSKVSDDRPLGTPDDLRAHAQVLDSLAAGSEPVLPFRFGTVLRDAQAVTDELLVGGYDDFMTALDRLEGSAQFTLRARYVQDEVLREVLDEQPQAQRLREELKHMSEDAGYYRRIELGQILAEAIADKRDMDAGEIDRCLAPLAVAVAPEEPGAADAVADVSFLVDAKRRAAFEEAAEDLARRWHGRIRLRLFGPVAPYDFVTEAMAGLGERR